MRCTWPAWRGSRATRAPPRGGSSPPETVTTVASRYKRGAAGGWYRGQTMFHMKGEQDMGRLGFVARLGEGVACWAGLAAIWAVWMAWSHSD
jgi:hypothetical protein